MPERTLPGSLVVCLLVLLSVPLTSLADQPLKPNSTKKLLALDVSKGWQDGTKASAQPTWKALPKEPGRDAGVRIEFPAIKADGYFNFFLSFPAGTWPVHGRKLVFRARAEPAGKVLIRLNEMPGAAEGKHDRHNEFEGHAASFEAATEWRDIEIGLDSFRVLWRHAASNGRLDLENVTGIGFEPADPSRPLRLELVGLRIVEGEPNPAGTGTRALAKYRIVFNSDRDGDYDIYGMDGDGRNLDRLTRHPGYDLWPTPSPNGQRIAWMTNRHDKSYELYVMNADGSDPVRLTTSPKSQQGHPTWSPDGKTIAFTTDRDGDMELYLMDADGGNWRRLTNAKGADGLPSFSPDGKQIVFVSQRDGDHELSRINVDGTGLTRLTERKGLDTMPAWSPDGKSIALVSDRDGDQAIFLMDPDGKNVRRVSGLRAFEGWPDWSPDGRFLCYHADLNGHFTICVLDTSTGQVERLTRGRGSNRNPRFLKRTEEFFTPPAIPAGGLRIVAAVNGFLTSGQAGPNPQKYPFQYRGYGVLDRAGAKR